MFGRRFHLVQIYGISIGFDISWFFIAILLTWSLAEGFFPYYYRGLSAMGYFLMGLFGMLGLFVSVVLHELGHALVAKKMGLPISRITLFLFGGIAELNRDPPSPKAEFLVAVAGPVVSVVLAGVFWAIAEIGLILHWPGPVIIVLAYLAVINLIVVVFNLIPAFPLDGGRMLRAFLWWKKKSLGWATKVSSSFGSGFGIFLILLGILVLLTENFIAGMWWIILGFFLQQAASSSKTQYYVKKELTGDKVEKYMVKEVKTVSPEVTIREFIDQHVYQSYHHFYPVLSDVSLLGYVSLNEVRQVGKTDWDKTKVQDILVPLDKIETVSPHADVLEAFSLFKNTSQDSLLVIDEKRLVGLLSAVDLSRIISLKLELGENV